MLLKQIFPITDEGVIQSMILQKKADELGIVISDKVVNDFLRGWTGDRVRPQQFAEIIASLNADRRSISQSNLFDALRFRIGRASTCSEMFSPLFSRVGPDGRNFPWRYPRRSLGLFLPPES